MVVNITGYYSERKMSMLGDVHVIYDRSQSICCSGRLEFRTDGSNIGCCGQAAYNVNTHICCLDQVRMSGLIHLSHFL